MKSVVTTYLPFGSKSLRLNRSVSYRAQALPYRRCLAVIRSTFLMATTISLMSGCRPWLLEPTPLVEVTPVINQVSELDASYGDISGCSVDVTAVKLPQPSSEADQCLPWWSVFGDDQLQQYIELGINNSFRLEAADARLQQVMTELRQRQKLRLPVADVTLSVAEQQTNVASSDSVSAVLSASYEFDLWGRIASQENIAAQQVLISRSQRQAVQQTVAGEIIKSWYGLAKDSHKSLLLNEQLKRTQDALRVISRRYDLGQGKLSDIWQQQQLVNRVQAEQIRTEASRSEFLRQLQRWTGVTELQLPSYEELSDYWLSLVVDPAINPRLNKVSSTINAGLLTSRPDIGEAWLKVSLSDAQLAKAISERFPKLSISARYSSESTSFDSLFDNWLTNLAANLTLPLLDAGQRRQSVEQARQARLAAIADYRQAWLEAVLEVQQALVQRQQFRDLLGNASTSLRLAQQSEDFLSRRYVNGAADFLSLLRAQKDALDLETQRLETRWSLLQTVIQLYKRQGLYANVAPADVNQEQ